MSGFPALAEDFARPPAILVESGVFCPSGRPTGRVAAPETEKGYIEIFNGVGTVDFHTAIVPGELGIGFGFRFRLRDGMADDVARVTLAHPPLGASGATWQSFATTASADGPTLVRFSFDEPYEIRPGRWTMTLAIGDETVLEQSFTVVEPTQSAVRLAMCKGDKVMS